MKTKTIKQLVQQDVVGCPNPVVEERLQQAFMARSAGYRVRQNSFSGFIGWLFMPRQLGVKLAFASVLLAFFLFRPDINLNSHTPVTIDTTRVDQSRVLDSALLQLPTDTTRDRVF